MRKLRAVNQLVLIASILFVGAAARAGGSSTIGVGNPASKNCVLSGGDLAVVVLPAGDAGYCALGKTAWIEQWTLFFAMKGDEGKAARAFLDSRIRLVPAGTVNPAEAWCRSAGGVVVAWRQAAPSESAACLFDDRSQIGLWTLFRGPRSPLNAELVKLLKK